MRCVTDGGAPIEVAWHKLHATEMTFKGSLAHARGGNAAHAKTCEVALVVQMGTPDETAAILKAVDAMVRCAALGERFPIRATFGGGSASLLEWSINGGDAAKARLRLNVIFDDPSVS